MSCSLLEPQAAAARKNSVGGTGELAVAEQLRLLAEQAAAIWATAQAIPSAEVLFSTLKEQWK